MTSDQINAFGNTFATLIFAASHGAAIVIKAWKARPAPVEPDEPPTPLPPKGLP